jgi:tyrosyl-tRNA synthetase
VTESELRKLLSAALLTYLLLLLLLLTYRSIGEECVTESELRELLRRKPNPVAYDGFEPSGRMHIAQVGTPLFVLVLLLL